MLLGIHDDANAIQRVLKDIALTGGVVFFPPGSYFISRPLLMHGLEAVTLRGSGVASFSAHAIGSRIVTQNSDAIILSSSSHISISHLLFTSNVSTPSNGTMITTVGCFWVDIHDIRVEGFYRVCNLIAKQQIQKERKKEERERKKAREREKEREKYIKINLTTLHDACI